LRFFGYLPAVAWAAFILYLGNRSFTGLPSFDLPVDKLVHLVLYGVLGGLAAFGWRSARRRPPYGVPLALSLLVGSLDEWNQRRVATRSADWLDWLVDVVAVITVFALVKRLGPAAEGKRG
jgi:VanZ family protein